MTIPLIHKKRKYIRIRRAVSILTALSVFVVLGWGIPGDWKTAFAYLIDADTAICTFTPGYGDSEVVEIFEPPLLQQSMQFRKEVRVRNTGNLPCRVRVFIGFSDPAAVAASEIAFSENSPLSDQDFYSFVQFRKEAARVDWEYNNGDGYFYYKDPLEPGESTKPLMTSVQTTFPSESQTRGYQIMIYEECWHEQTQ